MSKKPKLTTWAIVLIILGSVLLSTTMFRSGLKYDFGFGFWGPNGHDGIWHLSLINQLKQNIPPQNPIFSGSILNNYHWGFDLFVAILSKLTTINSSILYFQILPIVFAILIGFLSYKLVLFITSSPKTAIFFVFLNYFIGSFGWIVTLIKDGKIGGESLFWSMQSASTLLNPPYALSLIIFLLATLLLFKHQKSNSLIWAILIGLIFGSLSGIKIYAGILSGLGLVTLFIVDFFFKKKSIRFNFFVCLSAGLTSLIILFGLGILTGNHLLEFKPFWFTHSLIESPDKFFWPKLASFRYNQQNFLLLSIVEIVLIFVFLVGNMGLRILGFIPIIKKIYSKKITQIDHFFFGILFFSFLIPLFFVQKGTAWNTIQFFYYFLFVFNFYFALFLSNIWSAKKILTIFILLVGSITSVSTLKDYFGNPPPSSLPTREINALRFLKKLPNGYVLTFPYDKYQKNGLSTPIPLFKYETTSYVSAFSEKPVFMEDEMNLDITGFDWQSRRQAENTFFQSNDKFFGRGFLLNNQISYIYLIDDQKFLLNEEDLQINKIYDQEQIRIYQIRK